MKDHRWTVITLRDHGSSRDKWCPQNFTEGLENRPRAHHAGIGMSRLSRSGLKSRGNESGREAERMTFVE